MDTDQATASTSTSTSTTTTPTIVIQWFEEDVQLRTLRPALSVSSTDLEEAFQAVPCGSVTSTQFLSDSHIVEVHWTRGWLCDVTRQRFVLRQWAVNVDVTFKTQQHSTVWLTWVCAAPLREVRLLLQHMRDTTTDNYENAPHPLHTRAQCIEYGLFCAGQLHCHETISRLSTVPVTYRSSLGFQVACNWTCIVGDAQSLLPYSTCLLFRKEQVISRPIVPIPSHWCIQTQHTVTSIHAISQCVQSVWPQVLSHISPRQHLLSAQRGPYRLVPLHSSHNLWKMCVPAFSNTLNVIARCGDNAINKSYNKDTVRVTRVLQVQREDAWHSFQARSTAMQDIFDPTGTCPVERFPMFHGTSWKALDSICRHGLQTSMQPVNGRRLGSGVYTTPVGGLALHYAEKSASTSDDNEFAIVVTRVLRGHWNAPALSSERDMPMKPAGVHLSETGHRLDSTVDDVKKRTQCCVADARNVYVELILCCTVG